MRNLMNVLMNVLVMFLVLTTVRVFGQETFAPLITDNTILFVHLDLRKIEIDTIKSQAGKLGEELLKQLHFDEKSFKATTRELNAELEKLDALVRPPYETITKKLGIQELAFISDVESLESGVTSVLVASWKNKTEDDLNILRSLFAETGWNQVPLVPSGDFLFLPVLPVGGFNDDITKLAFIAWLQTITPSKDSRIHQGLQVLGQDEIKIVAALPDKLKTRLASVPLNELPKEIQGLLAFALQKIEWAAASFPLNALFSDEKLNDVFLTVKTVKRTDAVQLRSLLENAIEFGINAARFGIEQARTQGNVPPQYVPPLWFEFMKGVLRTLLPDVEGDKLIFRLKGEGVAAKQAVVAVAGIGVALTFPAIQAARETARGMQCKNRLKAITLAIHNYHDVYISLPPLYTVDKDGKPLHSWRVLILPFLEQSALYQKIRLDEAWDSEYNKQFHNTVIDVYRCDENPLAQKTGMSCYSAIAGEGFIPAKKTGTTGMHGETFARIADGTSNTLAVVEVKQPFCWMDPTADITLDELLKGINSKDGRVGSFHPNGINAAFFDGSVRFISNNIPQETLKALGTCNGGESVHYYPNP
jgi:prepilin-type processing-associated H-X9-DG protein